jgi:hypothetical protein
MRTRRTAGISLVIAIAVLLVATVAGAKTGGGPGAQVLEGAASSGACGAPIVSGDGADGTVAYAPCPGDEPTSIEPRPQVVAPTPGMADVSPRPFDTATVGDDDRTLNIDFWSGVAPCDVLDHVDVAYGADSVTVTLFAGHDPSAGDVACIDIAQFERVVVRLEQPINGRTIIDGALSKDTPAA